ncbi:MAG: cbb3-type cytochrome oxidase assembly protein CcoS [Colwellia sp.]|nr:cbb3-type cytochrome oxidase assembly protein CcoS [Colwellia sp.]
MSIIYILIPVAALLTAFGIYLFFWAVKSEQFDDLEKQGMSILFDEQNNKSNELQDTSYKEQTQEKEHNELRDTK